MSEVNYIKVWCEYDFGGSFGGNNNEEVFLVRSDISADVIDEMVLKMLRGSTSLSDEDLEGLYDWEFIVVEELK